MMPYFSDDSLQIILSQQSHMHILGHLHSRNLTELSTQSELNSSRVIGPLTARSMDKSAPPRLRNPAAILSTFQNVRSATSSLIVCWSSWLVILLTRLMAATPPMEIPCTICTGTFSRFWTQWQTFSASTMLRVREGMPVDLPQPRKFHSTTQNPMSRQKSMYWLMRPAVCTAMPLGLHMRTALGDLGRGGVDLSLMRLQMMAHSIISPLLRWISNCLNQKTVSHRAKQEFIPNSFWPNMCHLATQNLAACTFCWLLSSSVPDDQPVACCGSLFIADIFVTCYHSSWASLLHSWLLAATTLISSSLRVLISTRSLMTSSKVTSLEPSRICSCISPMTLLYCSSSRTLALLALPLALITLISTLSESSRLPIAKPPRHPPCTRSHTCPNPATSRLILASSRSFSLFSTSAVQYLKAPGYMMKTPAAFSSVNTLIVQSMVVTRPGCRQQNDTNQYTPRLYRMNRVRQRSLLATEDSQVMVYIGARVYY